MVGGEGLDNEWIEDRLKYCGEGPLDMAEYFQSGCYIEGNRVRETTQCCCLGDKYGDVMLYIVNILI